MNYKIVRYVLGWIILVFGLLMIPSIIVALIYREGWQGIYPFLIPMLISVASGFLLTRKRPDNKDFYMREGFVVVALAWLLISLLGALPFIISGFIPALADAFFEAASGFTTTGSSVLGQPELLPNSQLFWRSFTHLIGGMGILVFVLAVMPSIESDNAFVMKAEVPGPIFGKLQAKVRNTARVLYLMYFGLTFVLIVLLVLGGMPIFDSILHAFGAAGTGGFGTKSNSVAFYDSFYLYYVLAFGMLIFAGNFSLYYALFSRKFKAVFRSEELRWYLSIISLAVMLIMLNTREVYDNFFVQLRDVFFTVTSIISTTGFTVTDHNAWPLFSHIILLGLMFVGGMAGSTAGGLKVSRIVIYVKSSIAELRSSLNPNRRMAVTFEGKTMSPQLKNQVGNYLSIYILVFVVLLLLVSLNAPNFLTAFSAVAATFNNIGPGFDLVGPTGNFGGMSVLSKVTLSIGMIMGRLEIIPIMVLFSPRTWKRT